MNLQQRIYLLSRLRQYILSDDPEWQRVKTEAGRLNAWFTPEFTDLAVKNIANHFLEGRKLEKWAGRYEIPMVNPRPKSIGMVMAGNIPLVGFHDLLSVFITGNRSRIKPSSKDPVLISHLVQRLAEWYPAVNDLISLEEGQLKGCDAYIATGSNNSYKYFSYYFSKYPHIIRRNRTSVAVLTGKESESELENLSDDIHRYFGLGCRNVTKIFVPAAYDFGALLEVSGKYRHLALHHKYKNNYDYNLALLIMNNKFYMTNGSLILVEENSVYSPISQLHYGYYDDPDQVSAYLKSSEDIQCISGRGFLDLGSLQSPSLDDYADGVDTLRFLQTLKN